MYRQKRKKRKPNKNLLITRIQIKKETIQKQPTRGVRKKKCSENMQQI